MSLLQAGLKPPERIGDYDVIELGRGGMGVIYRARPRPIGPVVALKVIQAGAQATPEAQRRFLGEIEAVSALKHPHLVPINHVGEHEGLPYYTMPLYAGSLADGRNRFRAPAAAAKLLATVARAVHHAHMHGVLHRDLKPANILLDEKDQPSISDFGIAKRIGEPEQPGQAPRVEQSTAMGTPTYMAPEQACGTQSVTTAADVYSLGVVLYELLTTRLPIEGTSPSAIQAKLRTDAAPVFPPALVQEVPRDLQAICLKCLQKEPTRRYRTAEELADDLERFLRNEPVEARPASRTERARRFVRRHWLVVVAVAAAILSLAVAAATAISVAREQEQELQRDALRTNAYAAHALAGAVAFHMREQIDAVIATASDPAVARLLHGGNREALEQRRLETPFESISLFDRTGTLVVHAPRRSRVIGKNYLWRDYYLGASRLGEAGLRAGYISRVIQSEDDDRHKFGIAAPIYDGDTWIGVLMATIGNDFALKRRRLDHASDTGPMAVVVAPRDRSRATTAGAGDYVVVLHDGLPHGAGVVIDSPRLRELRVTHAAPNQLRWIDPTPITDDAHRDPVPGFEGRWLAGFAPVGDTGFVVIVQTRYDAAVAPNARLSRRLVSRVIIVLLTSATFGAGLWAYARRRRRSGASSP